MEIYQIVQIPSADGASPGKWQNTLQSDLAGHEAPVAMGPTFDTETEAQEWWWLNGPEKARRLQVTINSKPQWLRPSESPMDYSRIVELAGLTGDPTMTYHAKIGGDTVRQGTLIAGESLELAHGMRISVVHTDNA